MNLGRSALLCAVFCLPAAAFAAPVAIDFDALDSSSLQPVPLLGFSEDGYTFSLSYSPGGASLGPVIFDTTCTGYGGGDGCNGDADLQPAGGQGTNGISGNVLALQENSGSPPTPNDDGSANNMITFTVVSGSPFRLLGFSAVDDGIFTMSTVADGNLGSINLAADNDTGQSIFSSSLLGIGDTFSVFYGGSGGIDSIMLEASPVPVPAALPMLIAGVGALGWFGRRRNL